MSCSPSSSSRIASLLLAALLAGCSAARGPAGPPGWVPARLALFPMANRSGATAPLRQLQDDLERDLRGRGMDLVSGSLLDQFLARHRIRDTGGIDGEGARLIRDELGVEGVLLPSLDLYGPLGVPRIALSMRLVTASADPAILWMDQAALAGDDAPGLFDRGVLGTMEQVETRAIARLARSLEGRLAGRPAGDPCPGGSQPEPRARFRAPQRLWLGPPRIAVLPFANETERADGGELAALELVRQLARAPGLRVLEPGVVRAALLQNRVVMQGGVSHEAARIAFGALEADVVVSGSVHLYDEIPVPRIELTVIALATYDNRILWESTSFGRGDDGVFFFGLGRQSTGNLLTCSLVRGVARGMIQALSPPPAARPRATAGTAPRIPPRPGR